MYLKKKNGEAKKTPARENCMHRKLELNANCISTRCFACESFVCVDICDNLHLHFGFKVKPPNGSHQREIIVKNHAKKIAFIQKVFSVFSLHVGDSGSKEHLRIIMATLLSSVSFVFLRRTRL